MAAAAPATRRVRSETEGCPETAAMLRSGRTLIAEGSRGGHAGSGWMFLTTLPLWLSGMLLGEKLPKPPMPRG